MNAVRLATASIALAGSCLSISFAQQPDDYCAAQPPPKGLVARCQSKSMMVPPSEAALRLALTDWVQSCVSKGRGALLVEEASESVSRMWDLMKDLPRTRTITIIPEYEPLTFTRAGKTCYGVEAVDFSIKGASGVVTEEGPSGVTPVPSGVTDEEIKEAAAAATQALQNSSTTDNSGLSKFRGVLDGLQKYGEEFDDVWYSVAPDVSGDSCLRFRGRCAPADEAVKNCTRHLAPELVNHYQQLKDSPERLTEALEIMNSTLFRNFQYFRQVQDSGSGLGVCEVFRNVIKPRVAEQAKKGRSALYWYY